MSSMFPELGKTTVHIGIGNGKWIEVPMLSVKDYAELRDIQKEVLKLNESNMEMGQKYDTLEAAMRKMSDMVKKVMPVEYHESIGRLSYEKLASLALVLCNGDDTSENDDPQQKSHRRVRRRQPDA